MSKNIALAFLSLKRRDLKPFLFFTIDTIWGKEENSNQIKDYFCLLCIFSHSALRMPQAALLRIFFNTYYLSHRTFFDQQVLSFSSPPHFGGEEKHSKELNSTRFLLLRKWLFWQITHGSSTFLKWAYPGIIRMFDGLFAVFPKIFFCSWQFSYLQLF